MSAEDSQVGGTCVRRGIAVCLVLVALGAAQAEEELTFDKLATRGKVFLDTSRFEKALEVFARAAAKEPERAGEITLDWAWAHAKLGRLARRNKDYATAAKHLTEAAQLDKTVRKIIAAECAYSRMKVFDERFDEVEKKKTGADWQPLIDEVKATLEIMPDYKFARHRLAQLYSRTGKRDLAAREYLKVAGQKRRGNRKLNALNSAAWKQVKKERWTFRELVHPLQRKSDPGEFEISYWGPFNIHHHNKELAERVGRALFYHHRQPLLGGFLPGNEITSSRYEVFLCRDSAEVNKTVQASKNKPWIILRQGYSELLDGDLPPALARIRWYHDVGFSYGVMCLETGIPSAAESPRAKDRRARDLIEAQKKGKLMSPKKLLTTSEWPKDSETSRIFSCQSLALLESLVELHGPQSLRDLIQGHDLTNPVQAFRNVYGDDCDRLNEIIIQWANKRLGKTKTDE